METTLNRRALLIGGGAAVLTGAGGVALSFLRMGSGSDYLATAAASRVALARQPELNELVRHATLAANGHNTQPWRFLVGERRIAILPDFARRTPVVDPDDHHLYASLGCAATNLAIAGAASGRPGTLSFNTEGDGSIVFEFANGAAAPSALFAAIPQRQSTRADYDGRSASASDLAALAAAATLPGVDAVLLTERSQVDRVRDLVIAGNTAQMADPAFVAELKHWIRFNPRDALLSGDGLYAASSGNPILPTWLGRIMFDLAFTTAAENDKYARHFDTCAGVVVFVAAQDDREHWALAGQASQRFALQATALGLKHAFVNPPVEVARFRPELAALVGLPGRRPNLIMRFGYGPTLPLSPRRPVEMVLA
jgi:nitroreductase